MFARRVLLLLSCLFTFSCENVSESGNEPTQDQQIKSSDKTPANSLTEKDLEKIRSAMMYLWRDRESCTAVFAKIPETVPPQTTILTAGHCIAANPLRRTPSVKTPVFAMMPLSSQDHPRIGAFLADYLFKNKDIDTSMYEVELIDHKHSKTPQPWAFENTDRLIALYHDDFPTQAHIPIGGMIHRDYFSLFRKVKTKRGEGMATILHHFDLAMIPLQPQPVLLSPTQPALEIRALPTHLPGDLSFRIYLGRDNIKKELEFDVKPIEVTGLSLKHGLIQGCEEPPKETKDYISDRGSLLVLKRAGEVYLIGIGSFGSPVAHAIKGKECALTTFSHLAAHTGWMKITASQLKTLSEKPGQ